MYEMDSISELNSPALSTCSKEHGFRLRVEIHYPEKNNKNKYFIYLNKNDWSEVNDVMRHIQRIFDITSEIEIYIEDALLPGKETINLIQKDDTLIVKILNKEIRNEYNDKSNQSKFEKSPNRSIDSSEHKLQKKLRKRDSEKNGKIYQEINANIDQETNANINQETNANINQETNGNINQEINECLQELNIKKRKILKLHSDAGNSNNDVMEIDAINSSNENSSVFGENTSLHRVKKRKRKHKKKTKSKSNNESFTAGESSIVSDNLDANDEEISINHSVGNNTSSQKHIFFSEPGEDTEQLKSAPKDVHENRNDILAHLTSLASKPKYEKVFTRKTDQIAKTGPDPEDCISTYVRNEIDQSPSLDKSLRVIETPKIGDIINFTKIKVGKNYCPEPSGAIVGKVLRLDTSPDNSSIKQIRLEILQGSEEFGLPEGKFSLDEEDVIQEAIPLIHIVELNWHELLEPRLVKSAPPL